MGLAGSQPEWLTFDCYGTLIQWDEYLLDAVGKMLARHGNTGVDRHELISVYDRYEYELEQTPPHRSFRRVVGSALNMAMAELGLNAEPDDIERLTTTIPAMPPFPEVPDALAELKTAGFKLCIVSNTDDDLIAGNIAQLGVHIDRVVTAEQAQTYKPARGLFDHAHRMLGITRDRLVHVCASPHLDITAARDMGFRCAWINRGTGRRPPPGYMPDAEFQALDGVPRHFRQLGWITKCVEGAECGASPSSSSARRY